jgi:hypothetical protein
MLSRADLAFAILSVLAICAFIASAVLQTRYLSFLEKQRPALWRELAERRPITDDGNFSYAAAQWYLITGEYNHDEDPEVWRLAWRARVAFFVTLALLAFVVGFAVATGR